tara:strand:- start:94 stop:1002 length:909 start_codon:yes stop_codon:yes gene_type:complete
MGSKESNDSGRYFEYLVVEELTNNYKMQPTQRAKTDQERDATKTIKKKNFDIMKNNISRVASIIVSELNNPEEAIIDRLPDKNDSHADISIRDQEGRELSISLKYNSMDIFHGRLYKTLDWIGLDADIPVRDEFDVGLGTIFDKLHDKIPIGTKFAEGGILIEYQDIWRDFMEELLGLVIQTLEPYNQLEIYTHNLYKKIIGHGSKKDHLRIILNDRKKKNIVMQDLRNINLPKSFKIEKYQDITKDPRSRYIWRLNIIFSNGVVVNCRPKQDEKIMQKKPLIKPAWKVDIWGNCGMKETSF